MSLRRLPALVALLCATAASGGCINGDFSLAAPPAPAKSPTGLACSDSAECASGACVDGVCCRSGCRDHETCSAPGKVGICTSRELGSVCTSGAQCPTGQCVDGVCCESACSGRCMSCRNEGRAGRCEPAGDNTDLRGECGTCSACFGGLCAPAEPGTDPNGACDPSERCGASQRCGRLRGGACEADVECANGQCIAGLCQAAAIEALPPGSLADNATWREVLSLAGDREGGVAALVVQHSLAGTTLTENQLVLASRRAGQGWTMTPLLENPGFSRIPGAVGWLGRWLYAASYKAAVNEATTPTCGTPGEVPCGLFGQLVLPNGQLGGHEVIDAEARRVLWVHLLAEEDGGLLAIWAEDDAPNAIAGDLIAMRRRDPATLAWSPRVVLADAASLGGILVEHTLHAPSFVLAGRAGTLFYRYVRTVGQDTYEELHARTIELSAAGAPFQVTVRPALPAPLPVPEKSNYPCEPRGPIHSAIEPDGARSTATAMVVCGPVQLIARYRAHLPADRRWETEILERAPQQPAVALPLGRSGNGSLFAEVTSPARTELRLSWRTDAGWQHRPSLVLTGQRQISSVTAALGGSGAPRMLAVVKPVTAGGRWETWFVDYGP